ncbi:hypothetical protein DM860_008222 [Cuscuta australis]|uniref:Uncharacterized protein n=1 Tax=Cuscuta australis TaxID=267555 RepID=A0A328D2P1_9ASTE|nr:hypothetical protein DM860_008222 [Cuscuta australis]
MFGSWNLVWKREEFDKNKILFGMKGNEKKGESKKEKVFLPFWCNRNAVLFSSLGEIFDFSISFWKSTLVSFAFFLRKKKVFLLFSIQEFPFGGSLEMNFIQF